MHDGCLDDKHGAIVYYDDGVFSSAHGTFLPGIEIATCNYTDERIAIDAKQALSLFEWLLQEKSTLEKMVREQEEYLSFGQHIPLKIEETK